jgi:hypothetical protein
LTEFREGDLAASGAYDVSLLGGQSHSQVDGVVLSLSASRGTDGLTVISAPGVAAWRAAICIREISANEAMIEHVVSGPTGQFVVERLLMVRDQPLMIADRISELGPR